MQTSANEIRMVAITKHYGNYSALSSVDLTVKPGEFLTLLGPSGSGKSTLLMSLAGFVQPTDGNIFVGNRSILADPPERRDFGVVFQGYALFPHMTVAENLAYPLKVRKVPRSDIQEKVQQTLELVQLAHLAGRLPKELSGGQQQRVALARALVFSPQILLLDEPMGALDKNLRHDLQLELRTLHRKLGRTFVNVTHDQEEAMTMSDRIAIMSAGRIIQIGYPRELYDCPRTRFVATFLGKSNILDGTIAGNDNGILTVHIPGSKPIHHLIKSGEIFGPVGSSVLLALRPQKLCLRSGSNTMKAKVETTSFLGTHAAIGLRTETGLQLFSQVGLDVNGVVPSEGDVIDVSWDHAATAIVAPD
jgi:putative spermidine/putrescine transport system ATP-binding protein